METKAAEGLEEGDSRAETVEEGEAVEKKVKEAMMLGGVRHGGGVSVGGHGARRGRRRRGGG